VTGKKTGGEDGVAKESGGNGKDDTLGDTDAKKDEGEDARSKRPPGRP